VHHILFPRNISCMSWSNLRTNYGVDYSPSRSLRLRRFGALDSRGSTLSNFAVGSGRFTASPSRFRLSPVAALASRILFSRGRRPRVVPSKPLIHRFRSYYHRPRIHRSGPALYSTMFRKPVSAANVRLPVNVTRYKGIRWSRAGGRIKRTYF